MKAKRSGPTPASYLDATTETIAERAWRYGESAFIYRRQAGVTWFADGSSLSRWDVDTPRGVRHVLDIAFPEPDWSAA